MKVLLYSLFFCICVTMCQGGSEIIQNIIKNITSAIPNPFDSFPQLTSFKQEYDFIIIGCGASGSMLANRLTRVKDFEVLCLEVGREENGLVDVPLLAASPANIPFNWGYKTVHQDGVCEGMDEMRCLWPKGLGLGGSTLINYMMYTRGNRKDYDKWERLGNPGWGFNKIEKYFKEFEKYSLPDLKNDYIHGTNGDLDVQYSPYETKLLQTHLDSAKELNIPLIDINGEQQLGMSRVQGTIRRGVRLSAAQAFLVPIRHRPNLHIAKNAHVTKINIDPETKTAIGVEVSLFNVTHTIRATKEVILSSGTLNSPQLLMLSGIGPKNHLNKLGIDVIQDLPVGRRMQDHVAFVGPLFKIDQRIPINHLSATISPANLAQYILKGEGPYTVTGGIEAYAYLNTREKESDFPGLPKDVPDIELIFPGVSLSGDLGQGLSQSLGYSDEVYNEEYAPIRGKDSFTIIAVLLKPKSLGYVELNSKDPFEFPNFYPNYYKDERDLKHMLRGIRWTIRFGLTNAAQKLNPVIYDKPIKQCEHFTFNSDEYWMCAAKFLSPNIHHQVGTCKMGPANDSEAVVDPQLRVNGIKNLRVVDASIMPEIPAGHIAAACYIIGAKAADMIKSDYGV